MAHSKCDAFCNAEIVTLIARKYMRHFSFTNMKLPSRNCNDYSHLKYGSDSHLKLKAT